MFTKEKSKSDWLYGIIFNPNDKMANVDKIIVSFHEKYVQIDSEYYLTPEDVEFESILRWAEYKFDYIIN